MRVVVADDQAVICAGFAALLDAQDDVEVVGTAHDGRALVDLVTRSAPDLALVDVRMPVMDGIEATRRITTATSTRVLILTTFDLDRYVFDALRAGASGFLLKDVTAARLVEAVTIVAEGSMLLGPSVSRRLVDDFATRPGAGAAADPGPPPGLATLTARESEVFAHLAQGRSNAEIAAHLTLSPETIKSHVAEVLRKLHLRDRVQAVIYYYEHGLHHPHDRDRRW